jgi:hypothetical protein
MTRLSARHRQQLLDLLARCRTGNVFLALPPGWSAERLVTAIENILAEPDFLAARP